MGALQLDLEGPGVNDEEEVALAHLLVVHDRQFGDRPADVRGDADDVRAHLGVVGARVVVEQPGHIKGRADAARDDGKAEQSANDS